MKATLNFDLTDPDDKVSFDQAMKARDMALSLFNILQHLRDESRRSHSPEVLEYIDELRTRAYGDLEERGIDLDVLLR